MLLYPGISIDFISRVKPSKQGKKIYNLVVEIIKKIVIYKYFDWDISLDAFNCRYGNIFFLR